MMAVVVLAISATGEPATGAMIGTSAIREASQVQSTRNQLKQLLTRQDVKDRLAAWGISPLESAQCIDSLTDAEIQRIAAQIEALPSGGSGGPWGIVGIALVVTFLILLVTDLLGYTDFFNIR